MKKRKLELKKKTIATLSENESKKIAGGEEAYTTSFTNCTHFICCGDNCPTEPKVPASVYPEPCTSNEISWCWC